MQRQQPVQLIGLSGKIGSGKNEVARIIRKYCPQFQERAFAWRLKEVVASATGHRRSRNLVHSL